MTTATDQFMMFAAVFALAYLAYRVKEHFYPSMSAEESGYAPDSDTPPWGWLPTIAVGVAVCAALLWLPTLILRWLS